MPRIVRADVGDVNELVLEAVGETTVVVGRIEVEVVLLWVAGSAVVVIVPELVGVAGGLQ